MGESTPPRQANLFDFLRLLAAGCVVVMHATDHLEQPFLWWSPHSPYWFRDGVALFFVLSGLLVYRSYERCVADGRPVWQFYANRALRIVPALYFYAVLFSAGLFVLGPFSAATLRDPQAWAWWTSHLLLFPVYTPEALKALGIGVPNGSLWTIPVECGFYAVVPLIYLVERRLGGRRMFTALALVATAGLTAGWACNQLVPEPLWAKFFQVSFLPYLLYFGLGMGWGRCWPRVRHSAGLAVVALLAYLAIRGATAGVAPSIWDPVVTLAYAVPLSYFAVWFGYHGPRALNLLVRPGDASYGIYIWHMVVVNACVEYRLVERFPALAGTASVALVFAITYALALLSWHGVERPALRWKPFSSRSERSSPAEALPALPKAG